MNNNVYLVLIAAMAVALFIGICLMNCEEDDE